MFPDPAAPGSIPSVPDVSEGNQQRCSEESEHWFENVDCDASALLLPQGNLYTRRLNIFCYCILII